MKYRICLLAMGAAALACTDVHANPALYPYLAPTGLALVSTTQRDHAGNPLIYGGASTAANWAVGQWDIPADLPASAPVPGAAAPAGSWQATNSYGTVQTARVMNGGLSMVFAQDGALLPCTTPGGGVNEFDMLAAPIPATNTAYASGNNTARYPTFASKPSLADLAAFDAGGVYTLVGGGAQPGAAACDVNQGAASVNLVLVDQFVSPAQVLWYDVHVSYVCPPVGRQYPYCAASQTHPWQGWFWRGMMTSNGKVATYGVDDPITAYGYVPINDHAVHHLTLHFLPALLHVIVAGQQYGLDQDASHWKVAGYNFGQAIWGGTAMTTQFNGFLPHWTLKAAN